MQNAADTGRSGNRNVRAFELVERAVERAQIPGAALGVVQRHGNAQVQVWGLSQREPTPSALTLESLFDLASLTKVLFTLPEVLRASEEGLCDLDDPVRKFIPELSWMRDTGLGERTLRQLLTHTAGLPAWAPLYTWGSEPQLLKMRVLQEDWPLGEHVYSDLGFILLGVVVERLRGVSLRELPLPEGLTFAPDPERSVATERCPWRTRVLRGEVHDENAFALGGWRATRACSAPCTGCWARRAVSWKKRGPARRGQRAAP